MAILVIWSLLLGALLGRFFKVWVVVPACAFVLAAVLVRTSDVEHGLLRPLVEFAVLIASLQIGYVSGLLSIPGVSQNLRKTRPRGSNNGGTASVMPRQRPGAKAA